MNDLIGVWTSCFMLMFAVVAVSLVWMHFAILYMERRRVPELAGPQYLPEADILGRVLPSQIGAPLSQVGAQPLAREPKVTTIPARRPDRPRSATPVTE
jgi:hypothetical protein